MIADIFAAALQFFNEKIAGMLTILTSDLVSYGSTTPGKPGALWIAVENIYMAIWAIGVTIAGILIWMGLLQTTDRYAELRRPTVWVKFLVEIVLVNALLWYGKDILLTLVNIGQGITRTLMQKTGIIDANGDSIFHTVLPSTLDSAVRSMNLSSQIGLFIVVVIASLWIVISTCGVLLAVYGRLFNLYLLIMIAPLPISTAIGKPTRFVSLNYLKTFMSVVMEAVVIVLVLYLFSVFFTTQGKIELNLELKTDVISSAREEDSVMSLNIANSIASGEFTAAAVTQDDIEKYRNGELKPWKIVAKMTDDEIIDWYRTEGPGSLNGFVPFENADSAMFSYMAQIGFLFLMLFGMLKGTDKLVNRIFGV